MKGNWVFERSSGYAGYRCTRCATWIYEGQPKQCNCDVDKLKIIKKIDKIDGCHHCPLRKYEHRSGQSYCTHQATESYCVTGREDIPKWCLLPEDTP